MAPAALVVAWGGNHFSPLLLLYRQTNGYSELDVDIFFGTYILGLVPGFLLSGPLSDRYGRKPLMVVGVVLSILGSVILAAGPANFFALASGRLVSGLSVAIAMTVGTTWIKELATVAVPPASAARRASLSLTLGFGIGATVAGLLAQWGPAPTLLPYLVHIVLTTVTGALMLTTPETRSFDPRVSSLLGDLRPLPQHRRRFAWVVVPAAAWVFAAPALAFAIAPALVAEEIGDQRIAFATLLTVVALGSGASIQPFSARITALTRGRPLVLGLGLIAAGIGVLVAEIVVGAPWLTIVAAFLFGGGYGICMVCGLVEVQAMAGPDNLGGVTAVFYCLTYIGFSFPAILAALTVVAPYSLLLSILGVLCVLCAALVYTQSGRRNMVAPPARRS